MTTYASGYNHSFDTGIAQELGIHAALVFNHIAFWLRHNFIKKEMEDDQGRVWMFQTQQEIADHFGYLTVDEVKKAIGRLLKAEVLISKKNNKNPFDHTNSYSISDKNIYEQKRNSKNSYDGANRHYRECESAPSDSANRHDLYIDKDNKINKIEDTTSEPANAGPVPSADAEGLATSLFQAIKKTKPDIKQPKLKTWAEALDRMLRIDKVPKDRIDRVIAWLPSSEFWRKNILSAEKLREKFDRLELEMGSNASEGQKALNIKAVIAAKKEYPQMFKDITLMKDYVLNTKNSKELNLNMNHDVFMQHFESLAGVNRV